MPTYRRPRDRWEALWPEPKTVFTTTKEMTQSMAWTNWPLFTVGMVQMGYSDEDIQSILSGNVMRVAKAALS
jgi:membrane dipeptidase